jgi:transposase
MLVVEERFMIKQLQRQGMSISEIARQTGRDRKTVRTTLAAPLVRPSQPGQAVRYQLGPYVEYLKKRIDEGVLNASKLYDEIQRQGYSGSRSQLRAFVHPFRMLRQSQATVRFETEPGEQAQVDWGHFGLINHRGRQRRLYAFVMTLGWSRAMYVEFTVSADAAWWLRCHQHAFHFFGGVPQEVLHDNLKTAVLERDGNGSIHWNPRYLDFANYYGFTPRACQPYRAQTKGKVESGVKYLRRNFWLGLHFVDLGDLNRQVQTWLDTVANVRIHGTTGAVPWLRLAQEPLQPLLDKPSYDTSLLSQRRSSADCLISYDGNLYSVPAGYHRQLLLVRETEQNELLVYTTQGDEIARHRLSQGYNQRIVEPAHYQGITHQTARSAPSAATQLVLAAPSVAMQIAAPEVETRPLSLYEALATEVWP